MAAISFTRKAQPARVGFAFSGLLLLVTVGIAGAHSPDTSPRPAFLLPQSGSFIAQDAWDSVTMFDIKDGEPLKRFHVKAQVSRNMAVTADRRYLAIATGDGRLDLWDLDAGERVWQRDSGLGYLYDLSFSWDGKSLIAGGNLCTAAVFEAATGKRLQVVEVPGQHGSVMSVALSPDGTSGAFASLGDQVYLFDVATGAVRSAGEVDHFALRYSADGRWLVCGGPTLQFASTGDKPIVWKNTKPFDHIRQITPRVDGGFLIIGESVPFRPFAAVFNPEVGAFAFLPKIGHDTQDISPDGKLALSTDWRLVTKLVDLTTGEVLLEIDNSDRRHPPSEVGTWLTGGAVGVSALVLAILVIVGIRRWLHPPRRDT
jgi:WD40 repeat protein